MADRAAEAMESIPEGAEHDVCRRQIETAIQKAKTLETRAKQAEARSNVAAGGKAAEELQHALSDVNRLRADRNQEREARDRLTASRGLFYFWPQSQMRFFVFP